MNGMTEPQPNASAPSSATPPAARKWLLTVKIIGVVLGIFLTAMLADALVAARAEHKISQHLYEDSNLPNPPKVMLAGFPYIAAAFTHELEATTVTANDVDVPGFGTVSVQSSAQYVTVTPREVFNGIFKDAPARKVFSRLQLDVVSLGKRMGIPDLGIQNKDDISPRGGWETEAIFTGTPRGYHAPAIIEMKLRIRQGDVFLVPVAVVEGPVSMAEGAKIKDANELDEDLKKDILSRFQLEIPAESLPFTGVPMRTYVSGGSFFIDSEKYYTRVSLEDLAPPTRPLREEEQPGL